MKPLSVIIANINLYNGYEDFYTGNNKDLDAVSLYLKESLKKHLSNQGVNHVNVSNIYTMEKLEAFVQSNAENKIILFSNFPPNCTYKRFKIIEVDGCCGWIADSYDRTAQTYTEMMKKYPNVELHVITGAPEKLISDQEILSLSAPERIFLTRKTSSFDLIKNEEYIKSVIDRLTDTK